MEGGALCPALWPGLPTGPQRFTLHPLSGMGLAVSRVYVRRLPRKTATGGGLVNIPKIRW